MMLLGVFSSRDPVFARCCLRRDISSTVRGSACLRTIEFPRCQWVGVVQVGYVRRNGIILAAVAFAKVLR